MEFGVKSSGLRVQGAGCGVCQNILGSFRGLESVLGLGFKVQGACPLPVDNGDPARDLGALFGRPPRV